MFSYKPGSRTKAGIHSRIAERQVKVQLLKLDFWPSNTNLTKPWYCSLAAGSPLNHSDKSYVEPLWNYGSWVCVCACACVCLRGQGLNSCSQTENLLFFAAAFPRSWPGELMDHVRCAWLGEQNFRSSHGWGPKLCTSLTSRHPWKTKEMTTPCLIEPTYPSG